MSSKISLPTLAIWIIFAAMVSTMVLYQGTSKSTERDLIRGEVISYYGYLPATVIYREVKLGFTADEDFARYPMGLSMLYSPFFFIAHFLAPYFDQVQDGYSSIYQLFLALSSLFYVVIGLLILKRILLRYFSQVTATFTLLAVGLGTNLFYYTVHEGPMPPGYNFTLITLFLYLVIRWHEEPDERKSIFLGFVYGLIVLVKPSNIIAGLLFLAWGLRASSSCRERIRLLFRQRANLLVLVIFSLLPWIPQFFFWNAVHGSYVLNPFTPPGAPYFLDAPQLVNALFSYRKGWVIYTPVMLLAGVGLFFLKARVREGNPVIGIYLLLHLYLQSSWWSWWNGDSFGLSSMVDLYGVMALPLAALIDRGLKYKRIMAVATGLVLAALIYVNQVQTFQYTRGMIHSRAMTKEAYWLHFLKFKPDEKFGLLLSFPDDRLAKQGIYYAYPAGRDDSFLKEVPEEEGKQYLRKEIGTDRKLGRQISRQARKSEQNKEVVLDQVVSRVYAYRSSH